MSVIITEEYNVMVNINELIGTTGCLTLYRRGVVQTDVVITGPRSISSFKKSGCSKQQKKRATIAIGPCALPRNLFFHTLPNFDTEVTHRMKTPHTQNDQV
jgi:hypothetical protein